MKIKIILIVSFITVLLSAVFANAQTFGGGSGTINQLDQWRSQFVNGTTTIMTNVPGRQVKLENTLYLPYQQFSTSATPITNSEGLLQWNTTDGTLDLGMSGGDITMQIGQEMFAKVRNNTGVTIPNGTPVYYNGSLGNRPTIAPAKADTETTGRFAGLTTQDIGDNEDGYITTVGYVRQIKTNYSGSGIWGTTWNEGDILYVSKTNAGVLTNVEPAVPHHSDIVGTVGVVGALGTGSILVAPTKHYRLEDLSDVNGTPLTTTGQIPVWNQTSGYFDFTSNVNDFTGGGSGATTTINGTNGPNFLFNSSNAAFTYSTSTGTITLDVSTSTLTTALTGFVTSSSTSTDNSMVRFDGTTGKIIQDGYTSNAPTITDTGVGRFSGGLQASYLQGTAATGASIYPRNSTDTTSIRFFGNDGSSFTERMTMLSNGNFGIGTTTPGFPLTVIGTSTMTGLQLTNALPVIYGGTGQTSYTNGQILIGNSSGNGLTKGTITGTTNRVTVTNGGGTITLSGPQDLAGSSNPQFGRLGLGVAADANIILSATRATLGTTTVARLLNSSIANAENGTMIMFNANRTTGGSTDVASIGGLITDITNAAYKGGLLFSTANNAAPLERMRLDYQGDLGIGTTNPLSKLHVVGDSFISSAFRDSTFATGTIGQVLLSTGTSTLWVSTSTLGISGGGGGLATGTPNTMIYYNASGTPSEIPHGTNGQVLTLVGGTIIGDDPSYPLITGLGTANLMVDWDNVTYDRLLDYELGGPTIGPNSPMTADPQTISASGQPYSIGSPMVLIETTVGCGGLGYDEPTCTATGARIGDPAGYYVSGGVWRSASGGGESTGPLVPTWVTP